MDESPPTQAATPSPALALRARLPGTPYAPLEILGEGATGEVMLARHTELDSLVVVKLLHYELEDAPDLAERMRLEAQALARLRHPNIVRVLDYGVSAGRPFFAMEYLGGETLDEVIARRGPIPIDEVMAIARQLLSALGYLHVEGIIHRDIKPQNLLLCRTPEGAPLLKLIDFGVLKMSGAASGSLAPLAFPTETGTSIGTPRYLSPEQARGGKIDGRTDLYAAGLVLYEMLAGVAAFAHHRDIAALLLAQITETPRPLSSFTAVSPALDAVVLKAVAKDPSSRFADAAELLAALEQAHALADAERDVERDAVPTEKLRPEVAAETEVMEASTRRAPPLAPTWIATECVPASAAAAATPAPTRRDERPRARASGAAAAFLLSSVVFLLLTLLGLIVCRKAGVV